ncbi:MAG: GntR family transcriptional regulator [Pirellulales bacterium]
MKKRVYLHIRTKLLTRELAPGAEISHRELAKEIGVSFTPVREAIGQLIDEGMLECHPSRGTFVSELSWEDLAELYDIREALECHAVSKMAGSMSVVDLVKMDLFTDEMVAVADEVIRSENPRLNTDLADRWVKSDVAFHMTVLRAAGNRRALKITDELRIMAKIFGHREHEQLCDDLLRVCCEHRSIVTALREGNAVDARKAMAEHIRRGCQIDLAAYGLNLK